MSHPVRFCMVLHNHQPIGNFDDVVQQAYEDSYRPFLDVFEEFPELRISLHTSGPLMEWLDRWQPDYLDRLARLSQQGRIEIIGGTFGESILTMIPSRDRVGQIRCFSEWLKHRLGSEIRGIWIPERVWEQSLVSDIHQAGIQYFVLDDSHFKNAGLREDELFGYYVTENDGQTSSAFPGSEKLRYLVPFADPHETIDYLRHLGETVTQPIVVFGDDGEKFGTWPETKSHVYDNGWLRRFFTALTENRDWLMTTTLAESHESVLPIGKIYLPEGSYREMTEWALPAEQQMLLDEIKHAMEHDDRWHALQPFIRGGFWRNFKVRYPETDEMYARMMAVSERLQALEQRGCDPQRLDLARRELYRGQCNCSYWHGAFGGIYLPHLRNAVYRNLISADNLLDDALGVSGPRVHGVAGDFNFDGHNEVRLENDFVSCWLAPHQGGQMYELDVRWLSHNLLATLARRPEAYHAKVRQGATAHAAEGVSSIHDRVVFKQAGLDQRLDYDQQLRKSLIDRFYPLQTSLQSVSQGKAFQHGNFSRQPYQAVIRRKPHRMQVMMSSAGDVDGAHVKVTKLITLQAGVPQLELAYQLEGLPQDRVLHFAVEFNFAGLPPGLDDRYFSRGNGERLGHLGQLLDLSEMREIQLSDDWLGIRCELQFDGPTPLWAFPVETVSQSENGFELVHQSTVLQPHWLVQGDEQGKWTRTMLLRIVATKPHLRYEAPRVDFESGEDGQPLEEGFPQEEIHVAGYKAAN